MQGRTASTDGSSLSHTRCSREHTGQRHLCYKRCTTRYATVHTLGRPPTCTASGAITLALAAFSRAQSSMLVTQQHHGRGDDDKRAVEREQLGADECEHDARHHLDRSAGRSLRHRCRTRGQTRGERPQQRHAPSVRHMNARWAARAQGLAHRARSTRVRPSARTSLVIDATSTYSWMARART